MGIPFSKRYPPELVLDYLRETSPVEQDEHLRPQWACTGIERLPINFVGRVETMKEDVERLLDMGYLEADQVARFRHMNKSSKSEIADKARIDRLIRDVYAKDLELFGYD